MLHSFFLTKLQVLCFDVDVFILYPRFLIITEVLRMWIGFIWVNMGSCGELLWTQ